METIITRIDLDNKNLAYGKLPSLGEVRIVNCPKNLSVGDRIEIKLQAQTQPGIHEINGKYVKSL